MHEAGNPDANPEDLREGSDPLAKFNTSSFVGSKGATLTVTFDKPFFAEVQLQVRGYIRDDVMLSPGMVDFGEVDRGKRCEKEILVNHTGDDDWRIVTARCANPHLWQRLRK